MKETLSLVGKEFIIEWKQKYAIAGLSLYSFVMVFTTSFFLAGKLEPETWNVIFWLLLLFVAINAVSRSFTSETRGQQYYLYTLAGPAAIFAAKLVYHFSILSAAGILTFFLFNFFSPPGTPAILFFLAGILTGSLGLAACLSMVSVMASGAGNKATLFAVLCFPLSIPVLMSCVRITGAALKNEASLSLWGEFGIALGIVVFITTVSFILFPSLWRE